MYDIALYGHLVLDTIKEYEKKIYSMGGIINVWKGLKVINPQLNVYVCPTSIGTSKITIDRLTSSKFSESNLNEIDVVAQIKDAKINHIAYLNEIKYPTDLQYLTGIVTADICWGKAIDLSQFQTVDYLFVSEEDVELLHNLDIFEGDVIIHGPKGCKIMSPHPKRCVKYDHNEYLNNINVLGAGDHFAANYLNNLYLGINDNVNLVDSHIATTDYLKERE